MLCTYRFLLVVVPAALCILCAGARGELISHWTFDGTLEDAGPGGNDGAFFDGGVQTDPVYVAGYDGTIGGAVWFDGLDDYVRLMYGSGLPAYGNAAFTVTAWVKGPSGQQDKRVFSESSSLSGTPLFTIGTDATTADGIGGLADIYVRGDTNPVNHRQSNMDAFDDTWHHIAYVDANGTAALYIDGRLQTTDFNYVRPALVADTTTFGAVVRDSHTTPVGWFFMGAIDDIRVYDHVLTGAEIWALLPVAPCPDQGDTHCAGLAIAGPAGGVPGIYTVSVNGATDGSGDPIYYTFTADNGAGTVLSAGPQLEVNFVDFTLTEGTWAITAAVDDDAGCPDTAADAVCTETVVATCPAAGDTHLASLAVVGPADNTPGIYRLTAEGATDDSGDEIQYTFTVDNGADVRVTLGPRTMLNALDPASVEVGLTAGTWTVSATVDDNPLCGDAASDATKTASVVVGAMPPQLVAHFTFDGHCDDAVFGNDGVFVGGLDPAFVDGYDGTIDGAISLDGLDDYVEVFQSKGLPVSLHRAFTIAMWVKGLAQADRRVFCEGHRLSAERNPLVTLGTDNGGTTGAADYFVRGDPGPTPVNHAHSARSAFDGTWHHLALVDNGGDAAFYIDGIRDATHVTYVRPFLSPTTTAIGAVLRATAGYFFAGEIDDVRLYNYALAENEILALVPEPAGCPADGDTTVTGVSIIDAPAGNLPGLYTVQAGSAIDTSGDSIIYTFTAQNQDGYWLQSGPDVFESAQFFLLPGTWTISVAVDDDLACRDRAAGAVATTSVTVKLDDPVLISHLPFDGEVADEGEAGNTATFLGGNPQFVDGHDGTPSGALMFDGLDDLVTISQDSMLPVHTHFYFSVAMWVKGVAGQVDKRVFSEGSTTTNTPLFNLGTHNGGLTGQFDAYVRNDANAAPLPHTHSQGIAFDNTWHHVAWVDRYGQATLYIDGVADATVFNYTRTALTTDTTTIGGILRAAASHWFSGAIDDVRLYNYALTPQQIDDIIHGTVTPEGLFKRGDANADGKLDIADAIKVLGYLFGGGTTTLLCLDTGDANDDGKVDIADAIKILGHLFANTGPLPAPFPGCGVDPTQDKMTECDYPQDKCPK
ncbi:MAG TPA: hypothetical protein DCM87_11850 [Planctomycetes bacterium]|nr:hypothetical protein [Planctomycetota bacterium]